MDFLTNNPLINLRGPAFLGVFVIVCAVLIWMAWWRIRKMDPTGQMREPVIPQEIDPFEVAFLNGGYPAVLRLAIVDLVARGYLEANTSKAPMSIGAPAKAPNPKYLTGSVRNIFDWMRTGRTINEIMPGLVQRLESQGAESHRQRALESRQLLTTDEHRQQCSRMMVPFAVIIVALSAYKLFVALFLRGKGNVIFLVMLTFASLIALFVIVQPGRLTSLGHSYLKRIQGALGDLRYRVGTLVANNQHDQLLLAVAAFGIGVLEGTSYNFLPVMFKKSASQDGDDGGSSGSSCGSSCGSSSSCGGGGCGGCGGGGD